MEDQQMSIFGLDENGQIVSTQNKYLPLRPDSLVVMSNFLLNGKYHLNYIEWRLFYCMVAQINENGEHLSEYAVWMTVKDIIEITGLKNGAHLYQEIDKHIENLMKHVVTWEDPKGGKNYAHLVSFAKYFKNEGAFMLQPHKDLLPHLLELKKEFTSASLQYCARFTNVYTSRLYMLLKQFDSKASGVRTMGIPEIRFKLCLDYTEKLSKGKEITYNLYNSWQELKRWVIVPAQKEINKTDIAFDFEVLRNGKTPVGVKFTLTKGKKAGKALPKALEAPELTQEQQRVWNALKADPFKFTDYQVKCVLQVGSSEDIWKTIHELRTTDKGPKGQPIKNKSAYTYGVFKKKFGL